MSKDTILTGVLIEESTTISFIEVCHRYHIPEALLMEMIEEGFFNTPSIEQERIALNQNELRKMEKAFRLHRDLGVNLPGVALALELLEEMEHLRQELDVLKHL